MALLMISRGVGGHIEFLKKQWMKFCTPSQKYFLMLISAAKKKSVLHFHLIGKMIFPPDYEDY